MRIILSPLAIFIFLAAYAMTHAAALMMRAGMWCFRQVGEGGANDHGLLK